MKKDLPGKKGDNGSSGSYMDERDDLSFESVDAPPLTQTLGTADPQREHPGASLAVDQAEATDHQLRPSQSLSKVS